ncbi:MAG TPA: Crp/Fnr family transcriptional regulator, partial [Panacibacter sp.]|nr:Crp/Fnr family transcriptional regulator [Panacibacter sp.]
ETMKGFTVFAYNGMNIMILPAGEGSFGVDSIDLSGVRSVNIMSMWQDAPLFGFDFEVRLDGADGKVLGKGSMPVPQKTQKSGMAHIALEPVTDGTFHSIYFLYKPDNPKGAAVQGGITMLQFNAK